MFFLLAATLIYYSKGNRSLLKSQQAASPWPSKIRSLNWAILSISTFALGIQTSPGLSGCLPLNFLSVSMRSGSLPLLWPASSCSQSFPFHTEQLFLLIIPASSNYQQSMPQATLITEISRMLRNQLGGPLCLLICLLLQVLFRLHPTPTPLFPSWHILQLQ